MVGHFTDAKGGNPLSVWEFKIGHWRPFYSIALFYLRSSPFDLFKEFLRHGVVGHSPDHVQFTNRDGITFHLDVRECVQKAIFCFHYFEPEDVAAFRTFMKPGSVVFDVGANIGQYSLLASKLVGEGGQVYAFEPSPDVLNKLQENIKLNSAENIEVVAKAVTAKSGRMQFYTASEQGNQGVGSLLPAEAYRAHTRSADSIDVEALTLDDFCEDRGIERVDFLKIDVEGFDLEVLKGAGKLMERNPDLVVFSEVEPLNLSQVDTTIEDFYRFTETHGFQAWYAEKRGQLKRLKGGRAPYHPNVFFLPEPKK